MCGRYAFVADPEEAGKYFMVVIDPRFPSRYNIAPTQKVPVVRVVDGARRMDALHWGLIPSWAKDAWKAGVMINAKAETIFEKPSYRAAIRRRRCLVPTSGFYEWKTVGREKVPHLFFLKDSPIFAFAGIWEQWVNPAGTAIETYSIVTTAANSLVRNVHERMPVILPPDAYSAWLDPEIQEPEKIRELLAPFPPEEMELHLVSQRVNSPKNDDSKCMTRVG